MKEKVVISVENKLIKEKRGINIYHHATNGAHIISHGSSLKIPLETAEKDDYLHISLITGPGHLWQSCFIIMPPWVDFEFSTEVKTTITHLSSKIILKIQPGPPGWQLKITCPAEAAHKKSTTRLIITDETQD